jgi:SHS2 domain-containing protein
MSNDFVDFEEVEHTADWALRVRGHDLRELLMNAARGMSRLLISDLTAIPTDVERHFELEAFDAESPICKNTSRRSRTIIWRSLRQTTGWR